MLNISSSTKVFLCSKTVDMRSSFDGLAGLVQTHFGQSPLNGHLFVFLNKRRNSMKVLFWNLDGFVIYYKRLERGTFSWLRDTITSDGAEIPSTEFAILLAGISLTEVRRPIAQTTEACIV